MSEDTGDHRLLIDCERLHCRWPVDGSGADLVVCGDLVRDGSSYCEAHHARAHVPPPWRTVSVGGAARKAAGAAVN
ncbi:GcrA family cell cycle regulator [Xanthobacter autotrophicus]|uniref:GcrA family cell cycle regulator n=1 Tax=Xanthobacter autotrophicus TaxID=280 RepID=UPI003729B9CD